ncbi:MAG: magnesium transporter [Betaproteobacteria bacterium]|nr:magnesium transporter [Betaproteobacteria bacterium]
MTRMIETLQRLSARDAAQHLSAATPDAAAEALGHLNATFAMDALALCGDAQRETILTAATPRLRFQWQCHQTHNEGTVGRLMEPASAIMPPSASVGQTIARLRALPADALVTYCYVCDAQGALLGVVTMRDLLFAEDGATLESMMLREVFALTPDKDLTTALRATMGRHYPVYPVCDAQGKLVGLVRGQTIYESETFEITAQVGSLVGVEKEERISTPTWQSFRFRHPWLQLNLLTAFLAGGVVALFQGTIDKLTILAAFLPVLAGQSGNTGCQALAVTLRGLTLGEIKPGDGKVLVAKEGLLGALNGAPIGLVAGVAMYWTATAQGSAHAWLLALVVVLAMTGACVVSGISGAIVPLTLKRFGADPATASSIFLTTATDIVSMGMLLGLAALLVR